jgi:hypothetical protein
VRVDGQDWLPSAHPPPLSHIPNIKSDPRVRETRSAGTWPLTAILKRTPTKHPADPSLVLVCKMCSNAAAENQLARRTASAASFVPIPPELSRLTAAERAMIRNMTGIDVENTPVAELQLKESMVFPDLYPFGCGHWVKGDGPLSRSFVEDMEIKLNSVDGRWRDDEEWPVWAATVVGGGKVPILKGKYKMVWCVYNSGLLDRIN